MSKPRRRQFRQELAALEGGGRGKLRRDALWRLGRLASLSGDQRQGRWLRFLGRYRFVKLRWHLLMHVVDFLGGWGRQLTDFVERLFRNRRMSDLTPPPRRVLLVQLDHLGDAVLSAPLVTSLRRAWPSAQIEVLASPWSRAAFEMMPAVDRCYVCNLPRFRRSGDSGRARVSPFASFSILLHWARWMRWRDFDVAIDVRGELPIALLLALGGARRRVGWACGGGGFLLTDVAEYVPRRPEADSRWALLAAIGLRDTDPSQPVAAGTIEPPSAVRREVSAELETQRIARPLVVMHVGAGTAAKRWPISHWVALARSCHERFNGSIVLVGGREDVDRARYVEQNAGAAIAMNVVGRYDVEQLAALLAEADMMIGADSGPAHLAAALGRPTVVLFSGTCQARQWRPRGANVRVVRSRVTCSPCFQPVCPVAGHPCMTRISSRQVLGEMERFLAPYAVPRPTDSSTSSDELNAVDADIATWADSPVPLDGPSFFQSVRKWESQR